MRRTPSRTKACYIGALVFLAAVLFVVLRCPKSPPVTHPMKRGVTASNELFELRLQSDTLTRFETIDLYIKLNSNVERLEAAGDFSLVRVDSGKLVATKSKAFSISREAELIDIFDSYLIHLGLFDGAYELRVALTIPAPDRKSEFILPFSYERPTGH